MKTQLPLSKVAAQYLDELLILDPTGANWKTIGADHQVREAVVQLKDADVLRMVTPAAILDKVAGLRIWVSTTAISCVEWLLDWRNGKRTVKDNSLHYPLSL